MTIESGALPVITGCRAEIRQLLQNLISNAVKFRRTDEPPRVHVSAEADGDHWIFRIRDNGIGFDARFKDTIFRMFQRLHTRTAYEGTGIGLAHCKKVVTLHGGRIDCESTPGQGSTFCFTIPRTPPEEG